TRHGGTHGACKSHGSRGANKWRRTNLRRSPADGPCASGSPLPGRTDGPASHAPSCVAAWYGPHECRARRRFADECARANGRRTPDGRHAAHERCTYGRRRRTSHQRRRACRRWRPSRWWRRPSASLKATKARSSAGLFVEAYLSAHMSICSASLNLLKKPHSVIRSVNSTIWASLKCSRSLANSAFETRFGVVHATIEYSATSLSTASSSG